MKRYRCHKVVEAARIDGIDGAPGAKIKLTLDGDEAREVELAVFRNRLPSRGDYWVRYEDGYESWSPRAAFEAGYTEEDAS